MLEQKKQESEMFLTPFKPKPVPVSTLQPKYDELKS